MLAIVTSFIQLRHCLSPWLLELCCWCFVQSALCCNDWEFIFFEVASWGSMSSRGCSTLPLCETENFGILSRRCEKSLLRMSNVCRAEAYILPANEVYPDQINEADGTSQCRFQRTFGVWKWEQVSLHCCGRVFTLPFCRTMPWHVSYIGDKVSEYYIFPLWLPSLHSFW